VTAKTLELQEKETKLAAAKQWRSTLIAIREELTRRVDLLPRRRNAVQHRQHFDLTEALKCIDTGLTRNEGVPFECMAAMPNKPGLLRTDATIDTLDAECKALRQWVKRWPTPGTTNKFKYTGRPDKCFREGRYLEPGDVVSLSESAATANADMFTPV